MSEAIKILPLFARFNSMTDKEKEEHDKAVREYENEQKRINMERAFLNSGLPDDYLMCSFGNFDCSVSDDCNLARYTVSEFVYTHGRTRLLALLGANGTGKTHLAAAAIRNLGGLYRHSFDICAEYEDASNFRNLANKIGVITRYTGSGFLVIDEIGRATDQKTEQVILNKILTERIEGGKKTMIISNLLFDELRVRYLDNATIDRMNVYGKLIQLTGQSYRLLQAKMGLERVGEIDEK